MITKKIPTLPLVILAFVAQGMILSVDDFKRMCTPEYGAGILIFKIWLGDVAKGSMIVPPISREDDTTKKGAAKVILSLIALFGIMKGQDHEGVHGNVRSTYGTCRELQNALSGHSWGWTVADENSYF